jgi:hypothetical protein
MRLWYGSYAFPTNAVEVTSSSRTEFSSFGRPVRYVVTYDCSGVVDGEGQAELTRAEDALRAALLTPYQDLMLKTDSGGNSSAGMISKNSLSGVRLVSGPDFREAQGAEFVTRRTFSFSMQAEYMIRGAENAVISWTETVSITGNGGPRRNWRFPLNTTPIRQEVTKYSLVRATQSGSAVGHTKRPTRPLPIWPLLMVNEADTKSYEDPESKGQAYINWPVRWSYQFEVGGQQLAGFPNLPPLR